MTLHFIITDYYLWHAISYLHNNRIDPPPRDSLPLGFYKSENFHRTFHSQFIYLFECCLNREANMKSLFCSLCFFPLFEDYHTVYWQLRFAFQRKMAREWNGIQYRV